MKIFDLESPFMQTMGKVADLMWLNILTLVCCMPIITVGASMTALHYSALKIARGEECYITKDYFKSFKENFKQGTIIWLIQLAIVLLLVGDFYIIEKADVELGSKMQILLMVVAIMVLFTSMFIYPVLAKFENTILQTIKNSFLIGVLQFPKTILMMVLAVAPFVLFIFFEQLTPIVFCFCFSAPAWVAAKLYSKFFKKLEDQMAEGTEGAESESEEDERIFKDELDPVLADRTENQ